MKTDNQIQQDVMAQLKWEPLLNSVTLGVAVKKGVVILSGIVDSYPKKIAAETAVKKVQGVRAVAEDIQVGVSPAYRKTDAEIAEAVATALKWHSAVQEEQIKIRVDDGNVWLEGMVDWEYQRRAVSGVVDNLTGVHNVYNTITVRPAITAADIRSKIKAAFDRSATIDAGKINADVVGNTVTLTGTVRSFAEKEDAEVAAWAAPGVIKVDNRLEIAITDYAFAD